MTYGRIHHTTCNLGNDVLVLGGRQVKDQHQRPLLAVLSAAVRIEDSAFALWCGLGAVG